MFVLGLASNAAGLVKSFSADKMDMFHDREEEDAYKAGAAAVAEAAAAHAPK